MTVDAAVIPDVAITVDATMAVDATMDGELPCLAVETAAPAFSGSSACFAAAEIIIAADAITTAVMIAAGSLSFFCCVAEITDVDAADFFSPKRGRGYFLCPFWSCFLASSCSFFLSSNLRFKSISIDHKLLLFFSSHICFPY